MTYINFINMVVSTNTKYKETTILQSISVLIKVSVFRMNEVTSPTTTTSTTTSIATNTITATATTTTIYHDK